MREWRWLMFGGIAAGLLSCAGSGGGGGSMGNIGSEAEPAEGGISAVPNPSAEMATKSGTPLERLQRGHEVYMLKCGECHSYMLPAKVELEDWQEVMPKMIKHAGLGSAEEKAVLDYVVGVKKL